MKHFDPEPAPGNFGKRIPGLNLSEPQAPEVFKALFSILYEHRFLVIPGQDLTLDQYLQFGESFGTPIPHVKDQSRMEGHPGIQAVHNIRKEKEKYTDGAAWWHTDQSYEAQPAITTMLYSVQAPKKGGETRIADMIAAYEALSAEMKTRIADLEVEHLYGKGVALQKDDIPTPPLSEAQSKRVPPVIHKLVRPHPVTGQKTLYSPAGTSQGIQGLALAEAKTLLNELATHALQPRFQNKHQYAVGDVVLWDTAATMHAASPNHAATGPDDTRFLYRISVRGIPPSLQA